MSTLFPGSRDTYTTKTDGVDYNMAADINNLQDAMMATQAEHDNLAIVHAAASKATPADTDEVGIWDSAVSALKKLTWANLVATLKTYFDTQYHIKPFVNFGAHISLTISAGAITVTESFHLVDTEGAAATDDLNTINGGAEGQILVLMSLDSTRDSTVKDGIGNLRLAGDFVFTSIQDTITLIYRSGAWYELSRSDNA